MWQGPSTSLTKVQTRSLCALNSEILGCLLKVTLLLVSILSPVNKFRRWLGWHCDMAYQSDMWTVALVSIAWGYRASSPDSLPQRHPFRSLPLLPTHLCLVTSTALCSPTYTMMDRFYWKSRDLGIYSQYRNHILKLHMYWCSCDVMALREFSIMSFLGDTCRPSSILSLWCAHTWSSHSPRKTILLCSFYGWGNWGLEKWRKIFWVSSLGSDRPNESMGPLNTNFGFRRLKELNAFTPSSGDGLKAAQGAILLSTQDRVPRAFQQPAVLRNCLETQGHRVTIWILLYHPKKEIKSLHLVFIAWG